MNVSLSQGLFHIASVSHLILISGRKEVAQIRGYPVYVITRVILVPLHSQGEAKIAIDTANNILEKDAGKRSEGVESAEHLEAEDVPSEKKDISPASSSSQDEEGVQDHHIESDASISNVAQDVIQQKGQYGRFAERWFSRKGWQRVHGLSTPETSKLQPTGDYKEGARDGSNQKDGKSNEQKHPAPSDVPETASSMLSKILRTVGLLLESRSFFFAYDFDLSRRIGYQDKTSSRIPLHKSVDPIFFWNHHLLSLLTEHGQSNFILPLIQGFVGQRAFGIVSETSDSPSADEKAQNNLTNLAEVQQSAGSRDKSSLYLVTLISRRSIKRPGLRYLRRGVDESGYCANTVETEQILSCTTSGRNYSFTQVRASIPLFFSQSPYSFKPVPVLQHSKRANQEACRRHFSDLTKRYGSVQIALLVDKAGGEAEIGQSYEKSITQLNSDTRVSGEKVGFEWFDFHAQCRGMKFENVSFLIDTLGAKLDQFGETIEARGNVQKNQAGILRTNCMDCLDRTNVGKSTVTRLSRHRRLY